jgi:hypothetical protein
VRDLPDVSLFVSNGANLSAYPVCAFAGECTPDGTGQAEVVPTGGTSASAPAMAGIMVLVNQKYERQGAGELHALCGKSRLLFMTSPRAATTCMSKRSGRLRSKQRWT